MVSYAAEVRQWLGLQSPLKTSSPCASDGKTQVLGTRSGFSLSPHVTPWRLSFHGGSLRIVRLSTWGLQLQTLVSPKSQQKRHNHSSPKLRSYTASFLSRCVHQSHQVLLRSIGRRYTPPIHRRNVKLQASFKNHHKLLLSVGIVNY